MPEDVQYSQANQIMLPRRRRELTRPTSPEATNNRSVDGSGSGEPGRLIRTVSAATVSKPPSMKDAELSDPMSETNPVKVALLSVRSPTTNGEYVVTSGVV